MTRRLLAFMVITVLTACSSSRPDIVETSTTDSTPVEGQRVYMQVNAVTDSPPLSFSWWASSGVIEQIEGAPYGVYWTAPDAAGPCTITVRVTDADGNGITHSFTMNVSKRTVVSLMGEGERALSLAKQADSHVGGVWVSVEGKPLRYISSTSVENAVWAEDFALMLARTSSVSGYYTIWGASGHGTTLSVLTSQAKATLMCETCNPQDTIQALTLDVLNTDVLWVGTDTVLTYFNQSTNTWSRYISCNVHDLFEGPDYVYAATETGLYRLDGVTPTLLLEGSSAAVLARSQGSNIEVWSVTLGQVMRDFTVFSPQPPEVVPDLEEDIAGGIWCGKYRWDGSAWKVPEGLESARVIKTVASNEGPVYFLTDTGDLLRW